MYKCPMKYLFVSKVRCVLCSCGTCLWLSLSTLEFLHLEAQYHKTVLFPGIQGIIFWEIYLAVDFRKIRMLYIYFTLGMPITYL